MRFRLMSGTIYDRANLAPDTVITGGGSDEVSAAVIEQTVEARVDAALADVAAAEAVETAEEAAALAEQTAETAEREAQWTSQRLNDLETSLYGRMTAIETAISEALSPSNMSPLIQQALLDLNLAPSSSTAESPTVEDLSEAAAEALASNPEAEMAAAASTVETSNETQTEASGEIKTEAPAESAVAVVVAKAPHPRLKAQLI